NGGSQAVFPTREDPKVEPYSVKKTYGHLLGKLEKAFAKDKPLFALALYYPLAYPKDPTQELNPWELNRQKQLVRLIRILFLKRFESSIVAFESSCQTLLLKLLAFLDKNIDPSKPFEVNGFTKWKLQNEEVLDHVRTRRKELGLKDEEEAEESDLEEEFAQDFQPLDREKYRMDEIFADSYSDLAQVVDFLKELKTFDASHDNKLQSLIKLLKSDPVLKKHKVLIFSEFMTTARYLRRELDKAGIKGVEEIDSASNKERGQAIQCFAPYYNGTTSAGLAAAGQPETRILISTDVLSEGLNLQDATRLINYDLHWNPVRLMQRIGRVDRRLNPEIEAKIIGDHPDEAHLRGKVTYWNFLPPDDLDALLKLYARVSNKTLRISKVFGIQGKKLLTPEDQYEDLRDFTHEYQGELAPLEQMHLEFQKLLAETPGLQERLQSLPGRVFSGKAHTRPGTTAIFFCYDLPAEDKTKSAEGRERDQGDWTTDAGRAAWYMFDMATAKIAEKPEDIAAFIRSTPETPRVVALAQAKLHDTRLKVEKHIRNTYLKQVQAPVGVKPVLKCWMELT
ncbi:MAG: C-terminal helicase domain-containing protein, partial [Verrucomicrobiota bacterium]